MLLGDSISPYSATCPDKSPKINSSYQSTKPPFEGKAASLLLPGNDNVAGVHVHLKTLGNSEFTCVQALLLVFTLRTDVYV